VTAEETNSPAVVERPRNASCLPVVQDVERNLLLLVTLASDLPLRKLSYVLSRLFGVFTGAWLSVP